MNFTHQIDVFKHLGYKCLDCICPEAILALKKTDPIPSPPSHT